MKKIHLIDVTYNFIKDKYVGNEFEFNVMWGQLIKKAKLSSDEQQDVGGLYTDMLQDTRFIFIGNGKWRLREFVPLSEIANFQNSLYDFNFENETTVEFNEEEEMIDIDDFQDEYIDQKEKIENVGFIDVDDEEIELE